MRSPLKTALFLGQCSVEVEHEGIGIRAEFRDDEGHPLGHQPEMNSGHSFQVMDKQKLGRVGHDATPVLAEGAVKLVGEPSVMLVDVRKARSCRNQQS